ncbi:type I polyketide synthase [Actinomycetospora atypica]|uniref:SDR family NAD(P)-dependent oxidoreductase n=1 Tax=Actinomycetospora atypica TaxID=1290095 RepID=A0ABV9YMW9_9PSEU
MSVGRIAIVGIGLRYPDAASTEEYWENVLAGRRAFRRLPDERMNSEDYYSDDPSAPDRFYASKAAVLRDYEFDRVGHKVAGSTFRTTDMTHWLALDVAGRALADAGFAAGEGLPHQRTGVVLGNTLTGEFTRANVMRLRWPYVRRTVAAALSDKGWETEETAEFLADLERQYKSPFPEIDEDTLAGGLANTIAGRICNVFDLGGGGFTVDGACSSSLLSVSSAATQLSEGDLDVALAGGVDLSIDPFEVIGFAKTGALATGEMKVYDKDSNGFWPGEGCGVLVLMRETDAVAAGKRIYASIAGWGVSSDGKGGITRPEAHGHVAAIERAYARTGWTPADVAYFEGHGTGTELGDATEIEALSTARRDAAATSTAALGTVKGNIGHTKAAAGVAGLIKAALAVHHQVIPPATGHREPHALLTAPDAMMQVPAVATPWPAGAPRRAGVSAMGFGGVNSHIALCEAPGDPNRLDGLDDRTRAAVAGRQDAELLLLDAADAAELAARVEQLTPVVAKLSFAELADLAGALAAELGEGRARLSIVARSPEEAVRKLGRAAELLAEGAVGGVVDADGISLGAADTAPRIAFLFPGQGSGSGSGAAALPRRFPVVDELLAGLPSGGDPRATEVAQPRIVAGSLAALRVLGTFGITAEAAAGHSLGEISALHWAGSLGEAEVVRLATARGRIMADASEGGGSMLGLEAGPETATALCAGTDAVIAGLNAPDQTVVSGPQAALDTVAAAAARRGVTATPIAVSHAFHSPLVAPAAEAMAAELAATSFAAPQRRVVSTVTGTGLAADVEPAELLTEQIVAPVRFTDAVTELAADADLLIEVGPGRVLSGLAAQTVPATPVLPVDSDNPSLVGLLRVLGAAFALGAPLDVAALFEGRVIRPLPLDGSMTFLANPCESAPALGEGMDVGPAVEDVVTGGTAGTGEDTLEVLTRLAAERVELPPEAVTADTHPLDDLHLSSITVGQLVNEACRACGRPPLEGMPNLGTARLGEVAEMIDELAATEHDAVVAGEPSGIGDWVRAFAVTDVETARPVHVQWGGSTEPAAWTTHAPEDHLLAGPLTEALVGAGVGDGVLLCLPADGGPRLPELALAAAREVIARSGTDTAPVELHGVPAAPPRFVVVQKGLGVGGLARTLRLEHPSIPVTVLDLADVEPRTTDGIERTVAAVVAEVAATSGYVEVRHAVDGTRTVPRLRPVHPEPGGSPLTAGDVLLVTGGGKGITAESALALASDSGAALGLLGRSDPAEDAELAENLERMRAAGIRVTYARADVGDATSVVAAVGAVEAEHGPVSAVLHGAGRNEPAALTALSEDAFHATLAPKVDGLRTVLAAVDPERIKLLITFGSIIGRAGLRGEAHYATANDQMTELTRRFTEDHPWARAIACEWSVWSGAGMGEKLGVVEALQRDGITPIPTDVGIDLLLRIVADPSVPGTLVISGRTGNLETLVLERPELPLRRFVDRTVVHYPGIELITEAELSEGNDPYLSDHALDGDLLLPAVLGMEAMTQVAAALLDRTDVPTMAGMEFLRPVVVAPGGTTTVRIAALARDARTVDVAVRCADTDFAADHFLARLEFGAPAPVDDGAPVLDLPPVPLDPGTELYGEVLFQGKRFQRLTAYRRAAARHAVAEVGVGADPIWFAPFLPQTRLLADPGARDTAMHALQACVPDATLLPESVERLHLADPAVDAFDHLVLDARERSQDGDRYVYDVDVRDPDGVLVERWEGLALRAVRHRDGAGPWPAPLLGSLLERGMERTLGGERAVAVEPDPDDADGSVQARREGTETAVSRAVGEPITVLHRPDGRPEIPGADETVTAAHGAGFTLAMVGGELVTCDVEAGVGGPGAGWADLLGPELVILADLVVRESGDTDDIARTRVWTALECVRKTGSSSSAISLELCTDEWVTFTAGEHRVATWVTHTTTHDGPVVLAGLAPKTTEEAA